MCLSSEVVLTTPWLNIPTHDINGWRKKGGGCQALGDVLKFGFRQRSFKQSSGTAVTVTQPRPISWSVCLETVETWQIFVHFNTRAWEELHHVGMNCTMMQCTLSGLVVGLCVPFFWLRLPGFNSEGKQLFIVCVHCIFSPSSSDVIVNSGFSGSYSGFRCHS